MNKEDEIALVHLVITHPAGFDLDISGTLLIRRYEHPEWAVEEEVEYGGNVGKYKIKEFKDALEAAKYFVERRHAKECGLDFEKIAMEENKNV